VKNLHDQDEQLRREGVPLPWSTPIGHMGSRDPFKRTRVEAVESKAQMHARSLSPKPIFLRTSSRKDQPSEIFAWNK
jgi:hypothetical protein